MSIDAKHAYRFGFLKSEEWKTLRLTCIAMDEGKCVVCGQYDPSNDAHHLFYRKKWSDTQVEDLLTLCRDCHEKVHELGAEILVQNLWDKYKSIFKQNKREGACCFCKTIPDDGLLPVPVRSNKSPMSCKRCIPLFLEAFKEIKNPWVAYSKVKEDAPMKGVRHFRAKALRQFVLVGMDKQMERINFSKALNRAASLIRQHLGTWRPRKQKVDSSIV